MFGHGTMDFPSIFQALHEIDYHQGGLHLELSRLSHLGVEAVQTAAAFLKPFMVKSVQ